MSIILSINIHGTSYTKTDISGLSYAEAYQMLGACETVKDHDFICNAWNNAHPNALTEL